MPDKTEPTKARYLSLNQTQFITEWKIIEIQLLLVEIAELKPSWTNFRKKIDQNRNNSKVYLKEQLFTISARDWELFF